jgi:hypothetical protein
MIDERPRCPRCEAEEGLSPLEEAYEAAMEAEGISEYRRDHIHDLVVQALARRRL